MNYTKKILTISLVTFSCSTYSPASVQVNVFADETAIATVSLPDQDREKITLNLSNSTQKQFNVTVNGIQGLWKVNERYDADQNGNLSIQRETRKADLLMISLSAVVPPLYCYLERGELLDVRYDQQHFIIEGMSKPARQNIFLQKVNAKRKKTFDLLNKIRLTTKRNGGSIHLESGIRKIYEDHSSEVDSMISLFKKENKDASERFLHFMELDNKYFLIKARLNMPNYNDKTYHPFTADELKLLAVSLDDSQFDEALFSLYYRQVLSAYIDYLRINDPGQELGNGTEYIQNEVRLGNYVHGPLIKQYVVAANLHQLCYYERNNPAFLELVKENAGPWSSFITSYSRSLKSKRESIEKPAELPEITGKDENGGQVKLSDFRGKWLFIDIWATWCGPCKYEIPFLAKMKKNFQGLPVVFLGISVDKISDEGKWKNMLIGKDMRGAQMICNEIGEVYSQLAINGIPHFAIIDPKGKLIINKVPGPSSGIPDRLLRSLINAKPGFE